MGLIKTTTEEVIVCSINFEPPDVDPCSACHVTQFLVEHGLIQYYSY